MVNRVLHLASGTTVSRLTGLVRTLVLAYVLGFAPLADAYNLANTLPNSLYDLIIGGVVSATFLPVIVEQFATTSERRAWRSISSVVTMTLLLLTAASALVWCFAPQLVSLLTTYAHHAGSTSHTLLDQRRATVSLLRWFTPQIFLYGVFAVGSSLLQSKGRFAATAWAPVANNVICVIVLWWFHLAAPRPTLHHLLGTSTLAWLGAGTTFGLFVQFASLYPAWRRIPHGVRFRVSVADPAVRKVARLGAWTFGGVVANQIAFYVVIAMAFGAGGNGPVSAYTYGWAFMQMPYAVVVASLVSAALPKLAEYWSTAQRADFARQLQRTLRTALQLMIPVALTMVVLSQPLVAVLLHRADGTRHLAAGVVLAVLAIGLPGFTVYQIALRALQAQQRGQAVFWVNVVQNALNVVLALALGRVSLGALTGTVSIAYAVAAVVAVFVLRRGGVDLLPALWHRELLATVLAAVGASLTIAAAYNVLGATRGALLLGRLAIAVVAGIAFYGLFFSWYFTKVGTRGRISGKV